MRIGVGMIICLLVAMVTSGEGVDRGNQYCVFKGTADDGSIVTLDLSKIIQFPVTVNDMSNRAFTYAINLCESVSCSGQHEESACQRGGMEHNEPFDFSLGKISTAEWKIRSLSPLDFTVTYTGGDESYSTSGKKVSRSSVFHFMESSEKTTVAMTEQDSRTLRYTFSITGRGVKDGMTSSLFAKKQVADDDMTEYSELVESADAASSPCAHTFNASNTLIKVDLSQMITFPVTVADMNKKSKFTYIIDLCKGVNCNPDHSKECGCQLGGDKSDKPYKFSLGKLSTAKWKINKNGKELDFTIHYEQGDTSEDGKHTNVARSSIFNFVYSPDKTTIANTDQQSTNSLSYTFTIEGKSVKEATSKGKKGVQSGYAGLILIVIALCAVVTYFIVGSLINYQLRGARGVEVIPNINFWTELPLLIKDGCVFTFGPLIRLVRKDQGYEKI